MSNKLSYKPRQKAAMSLKLGSLSQKQQKRFKSSHRAASTSSEATDSDEDDESKDGSDKAAMLAALQAHGRAMFGIAETSEQGRRRMSAEYASLDEESDGLGDNGGDEDDSEEGEGEDEDEGHTDDGWGAEDGFVSDSEDEFAVSTSAEKPTESKAASAVPEVIFAPSTTSSTQISKAERKAFLNGTSAKMMGLKAEVDFIPKRDKRARDDDVEEVEDQSNTKLDKTLHDLLLRTLLPTQTMDSATRPSEKRQAIAGRLMELSTLSLPGEGVKNISSQSLSSHPAKVRTGLIKAKEAREAKAKREKEMADGRIGGAKGRGEGGGSRSSLRGKGSMREFGVEEGKKKGMGSRKAIAGQRSMGIGMGIGRFEGGMLKLSKGEIEAVSGSSGGGRGGRGRGGGGRGGGGRGRGGGDRGKRR